jgi:uncharacterized C2H2 Zn-finger protein
MNPWEVAKKEGKTAVTRAFGPMVGVYYPYRKSGDLYVVNGDEKGATIYCCQCDQVFPKADFTSHVNSHNKHLKKYPGFIIDETLVEKTGIKTEGKEL